MISGYEVHPEAREHNDGDCCDQSKVPVDELGQLRGLERIGRGFTHASHSTKDLARSHGAAVILSSAWAYNEADFHG